MKLPGYLFMALTGIFLVSCQKSYSPPDLVLGDSTATGGSGGVSGSGPLLIKVESKTSGSKESSTETYEYDGAGRLVRITSKDTDDTGASLSYYYRYGRDASGRVTKIVTNVFAAGSPGAGFPDSVSYTVHYPSSTAKFDYTSYTIVLSGTTFRDSTAYIYNSSGGITDTYTYQSVAGFPMALSARQQFVFVGGNIATLKGYDPSVSTTVPSGTFSFEFDSKPAALNLGNESFLPGLDPGYACANNITKHTIVSSGFNEMLQYVYQYNPTTQRPTSAVINQTVDKKTYNVSFTYQ